jgi:D-alanyl-D-alanine endopeptidase (penicillin-binding protein 7)
MSRSHKTAFGNILQRFSFFFGLTVFVLVAALPQANAAQSKRESVKVAKQAAPPKKSKSATVALKLGTKSFVKTRASKTSVVAKQKLFVPAEVLPPKLSFGQMAGLHEAHDDLELKSSVALVIDQDTSEVLFSKNDHAVLPIASLTKLMTGLILSESHLPMNEMITISQEDVDTEKGSSSRLRVGTELTRGELLHLALMSSENRAAHALGRSYPGGLPVFVKLMNAKAMLIGMTDTRYVEPTGLSSNNQSSARDLVKLVNVAYGNATMRELSTSPGYQVAVGNRVLQYNNTNRLVKNPSWDIGLQKTGYISEAGQCLVMQAKVAGRKLIMVFLDSAGKLSRIGDAERVRHWVESVPPTALRRVPLVGVIASEKLAVVR